MTENNVLGPSARIVAPQRVIKLINYASCDFIYDTQTVSFGFRIAARRRHGNVRAHTERAVLAGGARSQRPAIQQQQTPRGTRDHSHDQRQRAQGHAHLPVPGHGTHGQIGRFLVPGRHRRECHLLLSFTFT